MTDPRDIWVKLKRTGHYTKSYAEFQRQFASPGARANLHKAMVQNGLTDAKSPEDLFGEPLPPPAPLAPKKPEPSPAAPPAAPEAAPDDVPMPYSPMPSGTRPDFENKPFQYTTIPASINGREANIPLDVPSLTREERDHLLAGGEPTEDIIAKAAEFASERDPRKIDKPWYDDLWDGFRSAGRSAVGLLYSAGAEAVMAPHTFSPLGTAVRTAKQQGHFVGPGAALAKKSAEQKAMAEKITEQADTDSMWFLAGSVAPYAVGTMAAIVTAPISAPAAGAVGMANLGALAAVSYASGLEAYDEYQTTKGREIDPLARVGIGALYGAAEFGMESISLARFMPKQFRGKIGDIIYGMVPTEAIEKTARELIEEFATSSTKRAKMVRAAMVDAASGAVVEGATEAGTELAQEFANWLYKDKEDWKTYEKMKEDALHAALGGAMMGGPTGGMSYGSQRLVNKKRREESGKVVIAQNKANGEAVEVLGVAQKGKDGGLVYEVVRPNGKTAELAEADAGLVVTLTPVQFQQLLAGKFDGYVAMEATMNRVPGGQMEAVGFQERPPVQIGEEVTGPDGSMLTVTNRDEATGDWALENEAGEVVMISPAELEQLRKPADQVKSEIRDAPTGAEALRGVFEPGENVYRNATLEELSEGIEDGMEQIGILNTHKTELQRALETGAIARDIANGDMTEARAWEIMRSVGLQKEFEETLPEVKAGDKWMDDNGNEWTVTGVTEGGEIAMTTQIDGGAQGTSASREELGTLYQPITQRDETKTEAETPAEQAEAPLLNEEALLQEQTDVINEIAKLTEEAMMETDPAKEAGIKLEIAALQKRQDAIKEELRQAAQTKGDAQEQQSGPVRGEGQPQQGEGAGDQDLPKGDGTVLPDGEAEQAELTRPQQQRKDLVEKARRGDERAQGILRKVGVDWKKEDVWMDEPPKGSIPTPVRRDGNVVSTRKVELRGTEYTVGLAANGAVISIHGKSGNEIFPERLASNRKKGLHLAQNPIFRQIETEVEGIGSRADEKRAFEQKWRDVKAMHEGSTDAWTQAAIIMAEEQVLSRESIAKETGARTEVNKGAFTWAHGFKKGGISVENLAERIEMESEGRISSIDARNAIIDILMGFGSQREIKEQLIGNREEQEARSFSGYGAYEEEMLAKVDPLRGMSMADAEAALLDEFEKSYEGLSDEQKQQFWADHVEREGGRGAETPGVSEVEGAQGGRVAEAEGRVAEAERELGRLNRGLAKIQAEAGGEQGRMEMPTGRESLREDLAAMEATRDVNGNAVAMEFADDIDKAAYMAVNSSDPEVAKSFMDYARSEGKMTEAQVRAHSEKVARVVEGTYKGGDIQRVPRVFKPKGEAPAGKQGTLDMVQTSDLVEQIKQAEQAVRDARRDLEAAKMVDKAAAERAKARAEGQQEFEPFKTQQIDNEQVSIDRLSPEEEAGRSRGGEVHVEATVVAQGVHRAVPATAREGITTAEEEYLEYYAKEKGVWVEDTDAEYGKPDDSGQEQYVYYGGDGYVTKLNDGGLNESWLDFLDRIAIHNNHFPGTAYEITGFGRRADGTFVAIMRQPHIIGERTTPEAVVEDMRKRGFVSQREIYPGIGELEAQQNFYNPDIGVMIEDLHLGNVLERDGNLYYIDPVVKLFTKDVGGTREIGVDSEAVDVDADTDWQTMADIMGLTADEAKVLADQVKAKQLVNEIRSKPLTHVIGANMGSTEAVGTYISTEEANRYGDMGETVRMDVDISNPAEVTTREINALRNELLPDVKKAFVESLPAESAEYFDNDQGFQEATTFDADGLTVAYMMGFERMMAQAVTDHFQAQGHDALYFRESDTQEGMLVVFDRENARVIRGPQFSLPEGTSIVDGWYSPIEKRLRETKIEKQSANKWIAVVGKGDEATWTGVKGWLESKNPSEQVSKQEILDFMRENRVEIKEVVKGYDIKEAEQKRVFDAIYANDWVDLGSGIKAKGDVGGFSLVDIDGKRQRLDRVSAENLILSKLENESKGAMFSQYQLPGEKEDYKEVLVTLPRTGNMAKVGDYKVPSAHKYGEDLSDNRRLVHLRMNTRTDADGKKVLFLEEIQSDWGQKGKKEGFKGKKAKDVKTITVSETPETIIDEGTYKQKNNYAVFADGVRIGLVHGANKEDALSNAKKRISENPDAVIISDKGTPQAPFVTDTNAWTKLGLKIALREAVAQGVDKIAWTTGEQQNDRYDLSNQVDYITNGGKTSKGGTYVDISLPQGLINLEVSSEGVVTNQLGSTDVGDFTGKNLEDIIGKDIANRVLSAEPNTKFEGEGLKVGGKGMKGFYDGIVPNVAKALVKELTGQKVELVEAKIDANERVKATKDFDTLKESLQFEKQLSEKGKIGIVSIINKDGTYTIEWNEKSPSIQQAIEITPQIRNAVAEGLPQFQHGESLEGAIDRIETEMRVTEAIEQARKAFPNIDVVTDHAAIDAAKARMVADRRMPEGAEPLGFVDAGVVYVDSRVARPDTPMHEFGHIWNTWAKIHNPALYRRGLELVRGTEYEARVRANEGYSGLTNEQVLEEALALAIGERGAELMATKKKGFAKWLRDLWRSVRRMFTGPLNPGSMTLEQFTNYAAGMLAEGRQVSNITSSQIAAAQERVQPMFLEEQSVTRLLGGAANAEHARTMEQLGRDPRTIEAATGWHKGPDGKWRRFVPGKLDVAPYQNIEFDGENSVEFEYEVSTALSGRGTMAGSTGYTENANFKVRVKDHNPSDTRVEDWLEENAGVYISVSVSGKNSPKHVAGAQFASESEMAALQRQYPGRLVHVVAKPGDTVRDVVEKVRESMPSVTLKKQPADGDTLGDVIDIPHIYELYPEAKNIPIKISSDNFAAAYDFANIVLGKKAMDSEYLANHILHEVQHYVQHQEGLIGPDNVMNMDAAEQVLWNALGGMPEAWQDYSPSEMVYALGEMHKDLAASGDSRAPLAHMLLGTYLDPGAGRQYAYEAQYAEVAAQAAVEGYENATESIYGIMDAMGIDPADMWWYDSTSNAKGKRVDPEKPAQTDEAMSAAIADMGWAREQRKAKEDYLNSPQHDAMVTAAIDAYTVGNIKTVQAFAIHMGVPLSNPLIWSWNQAIDSVKIKRDPWRASMAMTMSERIKELWIDKTMGLDRLFQDLNKAFGLNTTVLRAEKDLWKSAGEAKAVDVIEYVLGPLAQGTGANVLTALRGGDPNAVRLAPLTDRSKSMAYRLEKEAGATLNDLALVMAALHAPSRNARVMEMRQKNKDRMMERLQEKLADALARGEMTRANYIREVMKDVVNDNYNPADVQRRYSDLPLTEDGRLVETAITDMGSGLSNADAMAIIDGFKNDGRFPKMIPFIEEVREVLIKGRLDIMLQAGLIGQEQYDALLNGTKEGYVSKLENYVPLTIRDDMFGIDSGDGGGGAVIHGLVGTDKFDITDKNNPIATLLQQYAATVRMAARNEYVKKMVAEVKKANEMAQSKGMGSYIVFNTPSTRVSAGTVDAHGRLVYDNADSNIAENSVQYWESGRIRYMTFPRVMDMDGKKSRPHPVVSAFQSDSTFAVMDTWFGKTYTALFNLQRALFTQYNFWFGFRNLLKDNQSRLAHLAIFKEVGMWETLNEEWNFVTKKGTFGPVGTLAGLLFSNDNIQKAMLRARDAGMQMTWANAGRVGQDVEDFQALIGELHKNMELSNKVPGSLKEFMDMRIVHPKYGRVSVKTILGKGLNSIGALNDAMENATRLSVFIAMEKVLLKKGYSPADAAKYAAYAGKNITVNFEQKGRLGQKINPLYMFLNVAIQGAYLSYKTVKTGRGAAILGGMAVLAGMNRMLLHMWNDDDEEKKNETLNNIYMGIDDRFILVANPVADYPIRIPKGYGITRIPINVGEALVDMMMGIKTPGVAAATTASSSFAAFVPVLGEASSLQTIWAPTIAAPLAQAALNHAWYGKDIQPLYATNIEDEDGIMYKEWRDWGRHRKTTNPTFVWLARNMEKYTRVEGERGFLDISPDKMEYVWKQYTGGMIKETMDAIMAFSDLEEGPDWQKFPLTRTFGGPMNNRVVNRLYAVMDLVHSSATTNITKEQDRFISESINLLINEGVLTEIKANDYRKIIHEKYPSPK